MVVIAAASDSIDPPGSSALSFSYADADQTERVSAGSTDFTDSVLGLGVAKTGTASTFYTRDNKGSLVGQRTPNGSFYYLFDGLGSVVGLTNASGTKVASYAYDPYGRQTSAEPSVANPWRFAGGYHDTQTDLTKFGTRYYDPAVGRWTQQDPVAGSIADPATMNRYVYVGGDPVNRVDPSGYIHTSLECIALNGGSAISALGAISGFFAAIPVLGQAALAALGVIATVGAIQAGCFESHEDGSLLDPAIEVIF